MLSTIVKELERIALPYRRYQKLRNSTALRRLVKSNPLSGPDLPLIMDVIAAWNNGVWTAGEGLLCQLYGHANSEIANVIECGSGLTTIVLGVLARKRGFTVHSLEQHKDWATTVRLLIHKFKLSKHVHVHHVPLVSFEDFHWYDLNGVCLPENADLILCDGPPGKTRGGRKGMFVCLQSMINDHTTIILDDCHRLTEHQLIEQWATALGRPFVLEGPDSSGKFWGIIPRKD